MLTGNMAPMPAFAEVSEATLGTERHSPREIPGVSANDEGTSFSTVDLSTSIDSAPSSVQSEDGPCTDQSLSQTTRSPVFMPSFTPPANPTLMTSDGLYLSIARAVASSADLLPIPLTTITVSGSEGDS